MEVFRTPVSLALHGAGQRSLRHQRISFIHTLMLPPTCLAQCTLRRKAPQRDKTTYDNLTNDNHKPEIIATKVKCEKISLDWG